MQRSDDQTTPVTTARVEEVQNCNLMVVSRDSRTTLCRDYIGIMFPYSLLLTSKAKTRQLAGKHYEHV